MFDGEQGWAIQPLYGVFQRWVGLLKVDVWMNGERRSMYYIKYNYYVNRQNYENYY